MPTVSSGLARHRCWVAVARERCWIHDDCRADLELSTACGPNPLDMQVLDAGWASDEGGNGWGDGDAYGDGDGGGYVEGEGGPRLRRRRQLERRLQQLQWGRGSAWRPAMIARARCWIHEDCLVDRELSAACGPNPLDMQVLGAGWASDDSGHDGGGGGWGGGGGDGGRDDGDGYGHGYDVGNGLGYGYGLGYGHGGGGGFGDGEGPPSGGGLVAGGQP